MGTDREQIVARLALEAATYAIDQPYSYAVPDELSGRLQAGMRVLVPFSAGNRLTEGIVLSVGREVPAGRLKKIRSVLDDEPVFTQDDIRLALWMRDQYFCTAYQAAITMLPPGLRYEIRPAYSLSDGMTMEQAREQTADSVASAEVLRALEESGGELAADGHSFSASALRELLRQGILRRHAAVRRKSRDKTEKIVRLALPPDEAMAMASAKQKTAPARYEVVRFLSSVPSIGAKELCYFTGVTMDVVRRMQKAGYLVLEDQEVLRHTLPPVGELQPLSELNEEQQAALDSLRRLAETGKPQASLLYGVTGSGKTQVYLHLIRDMLAQKKSAIVMVPEISLTPGLLRVFLQHFGSEVAVMHSFLNAGQRADEWKRVRRGEAHVVIGTRSAVFAPVENLGLIVLDEEQEDSYRSESMVRYHARQVAKYRCAKSKALLLLGSATPAVESFEAAERGQYTMLRLNKRYNTRPLPDVHIVDMKQELRQGNNTGISSLLKKELEENLRRNEQSILFLNRRGNSRRIVCSECGKVPECPRCSVNLTYHSANERLMCHYCGYSEPLHASCPDCGGRYAFDGQGTQRIQQELESLFPGTGILRMDADTISASRPHEVMLERFRKNRIPILLGTQMVAKGLDFENVTLVGVVDADMSLYNAGFCASERTFSLLTQVVGRAGRGTRTGRAVIQTWTPDNDIITLAARQDYDTFYRSESEMRRLRCFPPFTQLFRITVSGPEETQVIRACTVLRRSLEPWESHRRKAGQYTEILGPAPAAIVKVNNRYRYCLLIKTDNSQEVRAVIAQAVRTAQQERLNKGLSVIPDINPPD